MVTTTNRSDPTATVHIGDARHVLAQMPDGSADCIVTSPPYWGKRDYGVTGQYGHEPGPAAYAETLRAVFSEARRVLAGDGTCWLNLGDSYSVGGNAVSGMHAYLGASLAGRRAPGVRAKNLLGLPWRVAFALQEDGWILRNAIVWHKPNAMPESVRDRMNCRHELIFLLVKQPSYWFDLDPIRVPHATVPTGHGRPAPHGGTGTRRPPGIPTIGRHPGGNRAGGTRPVDNRPGGNRPQKYGPHTRQVVAARRYGTERRGRAHPNGRNLATKALLTPSQIAPWSIRSQARRRAGPRTAPDATPRHRPKTRPRGAARRAADAHPGRRPGPAPGIAQGPHQGGQPPAEGEPVTDQAKRLAFWGRVSTEDNQDPESSRGWQITRANTLIAPHGGRIVAEFFDIDKSRSIPPQRRPEASRLLNALADPGRGFEAVVVGEPQRAFYGNQFGNTFPLFAHYGVPLWVPEVGGPIDPDNEAHDLIMSVFGGVSKGERNRIKIRVRTAMAAQAQLEGRFLGGRPPYGYVLIDAGPHPNPAKAADGKRLHVLAIDEAAAVVVERIFAEFLAGHGIYAIAEHLTREGIPCPSAHDPGRNRHRCGIAWNKYAVRTILANPRYTGRQVWNRQRKDEVLIDVHDVALGHTTKQRWNDEDQWIYSEEIVHPPIIDDQTFRRAQELLTARAGVRGLHKPHKSRHAYALSGLLFCGICDRRMQGHWANAAPYYRCRFPSEYALANRVAHPLNVTLRQDVLLEPLDGWLTSKFGSRHLGGTIDELAAASVTHQIDPGDAEVDAKIADCDRRLAQYRATLDAGAEPATVARWITETEAERARHKAAKRAATPRPAATSMSRDEIASIVSTFCDVLAVFRTADPADKAEIYTQLGLRLTYQPSDRLVRTEVHIAPAQHWQFESVRGGT